jgi:hypothetical protein
VAVPEVRRLGDAGGQRVLLDQILSALSMLAAVPIARRIGLVRTMVFTHLPSNFCLVAIPFVSDLAW